MKSNFSRPFRFNSWISTKQYQKKVIEIEVMKIRNGASLKWNFSLDDFLGLQQSLCNIISSSGIFISKTPRKNLPKCTMVTVVQSIKSAILMTSVWEQFLHSKHDFCLTPTKPKITEIL